MTYQKPDGQIEEWPPQPLVDKLHKYFNDTTELISMAYDLNLMPEQHPKRSPEHLFLLGMCMMHMIAKECPKA
jgi:hypothetical protein